LHDVELAGDQQPVRQDPADAALHSVHVSTPSLGCRFPPMAETVAGRYRLERALGRGGMGAVWLAHDSLLTRDVAVKEILFPTAEPGPVSPADPLVKRALREAQAAARLRHPGIVTVHDVVIEDGRPWIVMELVGGQSLAQELRERGLLTRQRTAEIGWRVLDALGAAHRNGILHRDVKPANILLDGDGVVLTDFGITAIEDATALTHTGQMVGSPAFMAPERVNGGPATAATDLWALGVTLYQTLTGHSPFQRDDMQGTLAAILTSKPAAPAHAGQLWPVIKGLLEKDPRRRLTAEPALRLLAAVAQHPGSVVAPKRRRRTPWSSSVTMEAPPVTVAADTAPLPQAPIDSVTALVPPLRRHRPWISIGAAIAVTAAVTVVVVVTRSEDSPTVATPSPPLSSAPSVTPRTLARNTLTGHGDVVLAVAFNPDGRTLASGASDRTVRIWDTATGRSISTSKEHRGKVLDLAFSPDGSRLASAGDDASVRLWQTDTWKPVAQLELEFESVQAVAFSPDGATIAAGGLRGPVVLWDTRTLTERMRLPGHRDDTYDLAFSPDGRTLASGGEDGTVRVWNTSDGTLVKALPAPESVLGLTFSPDGTLLAAGGTDGEVRLWTTADWRTGNALAKADAQIESLEFSRDGAWMLAGTESELGVPVWHVATGRLVREVEVNDEWPMIVRISPDGTKVATGTDHHLVRLLPLTDFTGG
jgi:serine/threonine protein kinase